LRGPGPDPGAARACGAAGRGPPAAPGSARAQGARHARRADLPDADAGDGGRCDPRRPYPRLRRQPRGAGDGRGDRQRRRDRPPLPRGGRAGDPGTSDKLTRPGKRPCRVAPVDVDVPWAAGGDMLAPALLSLGRMPSPLRVALPAALLLGTAAAAQQTITLSFPGGRTDQAFNQPGCNNQDVVNWLVPG